MSWIAVAVIGGAALGGGGAMYGASKANKQRPGVPEFKPYSGYRPPHVERLRDVEKMITDTLMRRSQGQDVGYDPARREAQMKEFELSRAKDTSRMKTDINDRLSGMGLSRNLRAVDALYNRAMEDEQTAKDLYGTRIDIQDLERQNEERDLNTERLRGLNTFNFGQENRVADFDLDVYNAEQGNRYRAFDAGTQNAAMYRNPVQEGIGSGINTGLSVYGAGKGVGDGGNSRITETLAQNPGYYAEHHPQYGTMYKKPYSSKGR